MKAAPVLRARGLAKTFGQRRQGAVDAVRDATLDLRAGEAVLVMGPSGSGKTTLLCMLGLLVPPSGGSLEVGGRTVPTAEPRRLTSLRLASIGFVFQNHHLVASLTAAENVELPLNLAGVRRPHATRRARELLDDLGMTSRADVRPWALSGGERQRVAIARALATDPPVLLADEPTGNLDVRSRDAVLDLLANAAHERGKAVLIVSHDARLREVVDRVLHMEDGVVRAA